ncbi:MAG: hypothetical protein KDA28_09285, partial [Phycisphaerales bacterium]|nr:hypothetical protein [Phycisphaerales bacterium]
MNQASIIEKQRGLVERHGGLEADNVQLPRGFGASAQIALVLVGIVGFLVWAGTTALNVGFRHGMASLLVGAFVVLTICLGSLGWILIFHMVNAGWMATLRRQFENVMILIPIPVAIILALVFAQIVILMTGDQTALLYAWMTEAASTDALYSVKSAFLNPAFWAVRILLYGAIWCFLAFYMWSKSRGQDTSGDISLSRQARFTSGWGLLAFALTTAFAGFDLLMSLDYRFFSTMWGVYVFAGAALSAVATMVLIVCMLRLFGRLNGVVTEDHLHELGKLLFAFTVFWAYIGFSQYFLIWYSNIPEETAYYVGRSHGGWGTLGAVLIFGHFALPFVVLLFRGVKRS